MKEPTQLMSDATSTYNIPAAKWRVAATFASTDGSTPEHIEVECSEEGVDGSLWCAGMVTALADVAAHRHNFASMHVDDSRLSPRLGRELSAKIGERR